MTRNKSKKGCTSNPSSMFVFLQSQPTIIGLPEAQTESPGDFILSL